jgi:sulfur-oxidizing protein SoxX
MGRAALAFLVAAFALPAFGQEALDLFVRPEKGYCVACHQLPAGKAPESRNDVGPRLEGERMRSLGRDALRDLLNDPSQRNPDSVMPPFGRHRILDAREIDRLVEFLHALP